MTCSKCHEDKITLAVLEPNDKHEKRLCWDCILKKVHKEWKKGKDEK